MTSVLNLTSTGYEKVTRNNGTEEEHASTLEMLERAGLDLVSVFTLRVSEKCLYLSAQQVVVSSSPVSKKQL